MSGYDGNEGATQAAFAGDWFKTGDVGFFDDDGYLYVMGRIDDVINVAGHRLSTGAMEEVLATHPMVAECAVIGAADEMKGQVPIGFVVLNEEWKLKEAIAALNGQRMGGRVLTVNEALPQTQRPESSARGPRPADHRRRAG